MSTDYSATMVLGLRVTVKNLEKALKQLQPKEELPPIVTKGCIHEFDSSYKFCPQCGAPAKIVEEQEQDDPDIYDFFDKVGLKCMTDGCDAVNAFFTTADKWVQSIDLKMDDGAFSINPPTPEEFESIKKKLREKLEPYGLYSGNNVKIWLFGNVG